MRALNGEQHTLLEKMRKHLPHVPAAVIQEQICGIDWELIRGLRGGVPIRTLQEAWHFAPEGTAEREEIKELWNRAAQEEFGKVHLRHIKIMGQKSDGVDDAAIEALFADMRDLLYASPAEGNMRRVITGHLMGWER